MSSRKVSLATARDNLSNLVQEVEETGERVTITKHGKPAITILSKKEYESIVATYELLTRGASKPGKMSGHAELTTGPSQTVEVPDHPDIRIVSNEELVGELLRRLGKK